MSDKQTTNKASKKPAGKLPGWSDALFSCVYQWVQRGKPPAASDAEAALQRHSSDHLQPLAECMRSLVLGGEITPEWFADNGYQNALEPKRATQERRKLVLSHIAQDELQALLTDSKRIARLWPADAPVSLPAEQARNEPASPALNQMGPSQRGSVLATHYNNDLAIDGESDVVHHYNGVVWVPVHDKELQRTMAGIFSRADIAFSQASVRNAVDTMKLSLPQMGSAARHLIGFRNGVFDSRAGAFRQHDKKDWLLIASEVNFSQAVEGEALASHAPNFWSWLQHATSGDERKRDRLLAALFMVLANRYDWQLFLEVTGPGGSGKSVMAEICTMLAGNGNTVSANMAALENPRERALIVGYSLIILPDMTRYAGDGAGIKAITGGDRVSIDPKHKAPYSVRIPAVVLAVNNTAMTFSDRSGGISRRRVIFNFSEVVSEEQRDPMLVEKIEAELPVIIRHLLTRFADQNAAKSLLAEQRKSEEALAIKREGDSLVDFCGYLMALVECEGMIVGNAEIAPFSPRRYLYHSYLSYMAAHGLGKPVSLMRFGLDMPGSMAEYGKEYKRKQRTKGPDKGRTISNVLLDESAEAWLPAATGNNSE
ncbi:DNA primase family protein [Lelliottia wanjuensis]|uniref:DNA primase family protein n=1 Tax=Lelliottia wanjuensis TaxID=3050585 RepID=UPI00254C1307|nr:DUF5906 domain-containing protein [Lelliottia sp. V104_15]MDK9605513.1 DUF5906 domain-containing protein [Lelliottia sp. V104_15]